MKHRWTAIGLLVSILVIGYALAQGMGGGSHHGGNHDHGPHGPMHDMPGMHHRMMDCDDMMNMMGMHHPENEFDFLTGMIPHHREAVEHAERVLARSERSEMRELAEAIIGEQEREIELMRGWLEDWYPEQDLGVAYRPMMRDTRDLTPDLADRVFLEDMVMHHQMALMKAEMVLEQDLAERSEVTDLAEEIIDAQQAEIELMNSWLDEWYGADVSLDDCPGHGRRHHRH